MPSCRKCRICAAVFVGLDITEYSPAAYGAAALLALIGPDAHDDALGLDARAQDDRAGQTEGEK